MKICDIYKRYTENPDLVLKSISTTCQLALLIVATFGYFFTVKPVYTYKKLEEKSARIELEVANQQKKIDTNYKKIKEITYIAIGENMEKCVWSNLITLVPVNFTNAQIEDEIKNIEICMNFQVKGISEKSSLISLLTQKDKVKIIDELSKLKSNYLEIYKERLQYEEYYNKQLLEIEKDILKNNTEAEIDKEKILRSSKEGLRSSKDNYVYGTTFPKLVRLKNDFISNGH